jgi:enoyl-CoA hydratase/carnithine racemase
VAELVVDNPPLNLLSLEVRAELAEHASRLAGDESCRVVVVTGAGDRAFSAGSDIREFPGDEAGGAQRTDQEHGWFAPLANLPQPTIAAVHGHTLGGGLELALTCDIRVADENTRLGFPEAGLGLEPCGGGTARLPHLIGPARALLLLLSTRRIDAGQALTYGLVDEVVPAGQLPQVVAELAAAIASVPVATTCAIKATVRISMAEGIKAGLVAERRLGAPLFATEGAQQAVRDFLTRSRREAH